MCNELSVSVNMPVSKSFSANQGLIDLEKEVTKLTAKNGELEKQMEKMKEKMAKNDYKEKVPVKVQEADAEKVSGMEGKQFVRENGLKLQFSAVDCLEETCNIFISFQLRQNETELQKVKEAIENFRKMM